MIFWGRPLEVVLYGSHGVTRTVMCSATFPLMQVHWACSSLALVLVGLFFKGGLFFGGGSTRVSKEMTDVGIGQVDVFFGIFWGIKLHFWSPPCFFGAPSWMTCCNMSDGDVCWGGRDGGLLLGHRTPYGDRIKLTTFNSSNSIVDEHMFPYNPYSYFYIKYRTLNKLNMWAFWLPSPPKGC